MIDWLNGPPGRAWLSAGALLVALAAPPWLHRAFNGDVGRPGPLPIMHQVGKTKSRQQRAITFVLSGANHASSWACKPDR